MVSGFWLNAFPRSRTPAHAPQPRSAARLGHSEGTGSWAKRRGLVAGNPVADLEGRERPRIGRKQQRAFEPAEIKALRAAAEPKYRPLLATALFSGLRVMEVLASRWQDIDLTQKEIHVRAQEPGRLPRQAP